MMQAASSASPARKGSFTPRAILSTPKPSPRKSKAAGRAKPVNPPNFLGDITFSDDKALVNKVIQVGNSHFEYGYNMGELKDSSELYRQHKRKELLDRLEEEGYLLIRGAIGLEKAKAARKMLLENLKDKKALIINSKYTMDDAMIKNIHEEGWTVDAESGGFVNDRESEEAFERWREIGWSDEVRGVYNGPELHALYQFLWGQERTDTTDGYQALPEITWMRAKGNGEVTAEHTDYYYFKQNTTTFRDHIHPYVLSDAQVYNERNPIPEGEESIICDICHRHFAVNTQYPQPTNWDKEAEGEWHCRSCASQPLPIYTTWICLGDYGPNSSSLCVMPRSHRLIDFDQPLRGDLLPNDYNDLVRAKWGWCRTTFGPGDIVLFNIKTVHGANKNASKMFRLSLDTRVSSCWIRPKVLYPDATVKYEPPTEPEEILSTTTTEGAVPSTPYIPQCTSDKAPSTLSEKFITEMQARMEAEERDGPSVTSQQRPRKIGMMGASQPRQRSRRSDGGMDILSNQDLDEHRDDDTHCVVTSVEVTPNAANTSSDTPLTAIASGENVNSSAASSATVADAPTTTAFPSVDAHVGLQKKRKRDIRIAADGVNVLSESDYTETEEDSTNPSVITRPTQRRALRQRPTRVLLDLEQQSDGEDDSTTIVRLTAHATHELPAVAEDDEEEGAEQDA